MFLPSAEQVLLPEGKQGMTNLDAALLLLRVVLGLTMAAHGYSKLFMGGRIQGTSKWFSGLGMRPGAFHAWLAAITEIAAGLAFAAGLLTPFASAAFVALMLVAAWTVHRRKGFFIVGGGWEYTLILAAGAVATAVAGAGRISLDWLLFNGNLLEGWPGLLLAALGGTVAAIALLALFYRPSESQKS